MIKNEKMNRKTFIVNVVLLLKIIFANFQIYFLNENFLATEKRFRKYVPSVGDLRI